MIRVRIEGTEEEMLEFMEKMPDIPGFEKTHTREPRKGNNPKYDSSKNVLAYLSYKKIEVANNEVTPKS
ncbi:YvzF family protein [Bacillus paranthracis]|uniref:YvzF family protein n=1 Tax=Bacillus paranthracis TaxID=2026186 RepID=A0AAJ1KE38_9BACI|nr:YvzF family protein [Bacillus paranthracis]MDG0948677.1 YvzF family protein [Bacillus paranthracis]MDG0954700.1 YvzF family protein [Bacillus paranthracis]